MAHPYPHTVKSAFTLVELLVVISIIALLLAILLPSLNKARAAAQAIKCSATLRQQGLAVQLYTSDNDSHFPVMETGQASGDGNFRETWDVLLQPYLIAVMDPNGTTVGRKVTSSRNVFVCPSDSIRTSDHRSYQFNGVEDYGFGAGPNGIKLSQSRLSNWISGGTNPLFSATLSKIITPADTIEECEFSTASTFLANLSNNSANGGPYYQISPAEDGRLTNTADNPLHNGNCNYLFVDGHVEPLSPPQTNNGVQNYSGDPSQVHGKWTTDPND